MKGKILLASVVAAQLVGCYTMYTSLYIGELCGTIPLLQPEEKLYSVPAQARSDTIKEVNSIMLDYGFEPGPDRHEPLRAVWFPADKTKIAPKAGNLEGRNAYITVALDTECLSAAVQDHDNLTETEFVRTLKNRISAVIEKYFDGAKVVFKRQQNWLGP